MRGTCHGARRGFVLLLARTRRGTSASLNIAPTNFNARPSTSYTPHASLLHCSIARNVCRFYRTLRATSCPNITRAAVNLRKRKRKRKRESPLPTLSPWEGDTIAVTPRRTVTGQVSGERAPLRDTQRGNEVPQSRIASRIESMCLP
jgi:hypothetical protein